MNEKILNNLLDDLATSHRIVANDKDKMRLTRYYKTLNDFIIEYKTLQFKIDKANELLDGLLKDAYYNGEYIQYDYSTNDLLELKDILKEDK